MMRLFVKLGSYVPVAAETEIRFLSPQVTLSGHRRVDGMAVLARDKKRFVFANIPVHHPSHILVATEAFCVPGGRAFLFAKYKNGNASTTAFFNMLSPGAMARLTTVSVGGISRYRLLAMYRFHKLVVLALVAIFAGFRPDKP